MRFEVNELQARTALAAALAANGSEREQLLHVAEHHTEKLGREGLAWTSAITTLRRAGICAARKDDDGAVRELRAAITACDAAALGLHAAAARVRLGTLLGGDEGEALRDDGFATLRAEEVKNLDAFVALYVP